jgi:tape measure domain-containing protein
MAETLGQAVLEVGIDDTRLRAGLQGVEGQVKRTSGIVQSLATAFAGISAVAVFQDLIKSATELENITRKLTNTLGDQGAQQAIGFLRGLSDDLGLSFNVLADSFGSFTAAASAANIPLSEQKDLFAAVSTSAQRLGLSNDAINGSLLALQQVAAKGTVQMEELRGQLGERLPTAFAATSRGLGISNAELIKLVESGRLTAEQFFPALTKGLNELNGTGTASVPTAAQNFASLGNELEKLKADFGTEFLPGVVAAVQAIAGALKGLSAENEARGLGLGASLGGVSTDALDVVGNLQRLRQEFGLSNQQSKEIAIQALNEVGASVGFFSGLRLTAEQIDTVRTRLAELAKERTAVARAAAAAEEAEIVDARAAQAAADKRLDTLDKINARLKTARKELGGLDPQSSDAKAKQEEIANLQAQALSVEKAAEVSKKAAEAIKKAQDEAARKSKEVADNYLKAAEASKSAAQSFAEVVAGSRFASESAQRQARETLERRAAAALNSGAVNRDAVSREFGLGLAGAGSLSIQGGGQSFSRSFNGQVGALDLRSLGLDRLSELVQQTAPLADGAKSVQESNKELQAALKDLKTGIDTSNQRESNLAITVPVGGQKEVYLP